MIGQTQQFAQESEESLHRCFWDDWRRISHSYANWWAFLLLFCWPAHTAEKLQRIRLELPVSEAGDVLTVGHLVDQICVETGIDLWNQIIIFKGFKPIATIEFFLLTYAVYLIKACCPQYITVGRFVMKKDLFIF